MDSLGFCFSFCLSEQKELRRTLLTKTHLYLVLQSIAKTTEIVILKRLDLIASHTSILVIKIEKT